MRCPTSRKPAHDASFMENRVAGRLWLTTRHLCAMSTRSRTVRCTRETRRSTETPGLSGQIPPTSVPLLSTSRVALNMYLASSYSPNRYTALAGEQSLVVLSLCA